MNTNNSLRVAVALLISAATQGAMAASLSDPIKIADEEPDFGTSVAKVGTAASLSIDVPVISGRNISSTTPYYVVITLTGGATFSTGAVSLTCGYSAAGKSMVPAATDSPAASSGGRVAAFRLESAAGNGILTASTCLLTMASNANGALQLTSGKKEYGIVVTARHLDPADPVSASQPGGLITFVQGLQLSVEQGGVTVDVTSPSLSKKFQTDPSSVNTQGVSDLLGTIKYAAVDGVLLLDGNAASVSLNDSLTRYVNGGVSLFLSGSPLLATQDTAAKPADGAMTAGIFLGTDFRCTDSGAASMGGGLTAASGTQVSFTLSLGEYQSRGGIIYVCMNTNGLATIDRGVVSFSMTPAITTAKPNMGIIDNTLVKVVKNGTSIKVLNIPNPENSTDQSFIRFYNMGVNPGKIYGTLYGQNGTVLGTPNALLIDNMAKDAVATLDATALAKAFVIAKDPATGVSWAGRAWLQVESEIKGLRIQALIRANGAGGVLINMSDRVLADDEELTQRYQETH